jgi:hypothetical protein
MKPPTLIYVIDSDVLIAAHRRYYGFSFCPAFWDFLLRQHSDGRLFSIDRVHAEITPGDELADWAKNSIPPSFFASTQDQVVIAAYTTMEQWVQGESQFMPAAKAEFAGVADGWLAAYAQAHSDRILVTNELHSPNAKARVPLPNVCRQFGVPYIDTFGMLKDLGARFLLSS